MIKSLFVNNSFIYISLCFFNWIVFFLFPRADVSGHQPCFIAYFLLIAMFLISIAVFFMRWDNRWILAIILVSVPIEMRRDIVNSFTISTCEWLLFLVLIAWAIKLVYEKRIPAFHLKLIIPLVIFILLITVSFLKVQELSVSMKWTIRWFEVFLAYLLISDMKLTESEHRFVINSVIITGVILGIIGIFQFVQHMGDSYKSVRSILNHHNAFGEYLALISPLLFPFLKKKRVYMFALSMLFLALCLSSSRGAMIGFSSAFLVFLIIDRKWIMMKRNIIFMTLLAVGAMVVVLSQKDFRRRWKNVFTNPTIASKGRFKHYEESFRVIKKNPLGVGIGNFYFNWNKRWVRAGIGTHNIYLYVTVELGIAGLIVFIWWLGSHMLLFIKNLSSVDKGKVNPLLLGIFCSCVSFIVYSLFDDFFNNSLGIACGLIMGWGVAVVNSVEQEVKEHA